MGLVEKINGEALDQLVQSGEKILADFYSDSCGPCKMLGFVLEDVAKSVEGVHIVKLDFDSNKETMEKYNVAGYPTMVIFEGGQEINRMKGLQQKPAIIKAIQG